MIESRQAEQRVLVDSMEAAALRPFTDSAIPIGASRSDVTRLMTEIILKRSLTPFTYKALCVPLHYNGIPLPVRRFARLAPEQDCVVHVWTVNDTRVATDLWLAGIAGIISDDPAAMLRARALLPR